jgi:hypothetical protein
MSAVLIKNINSFSSFIERGIHTFHHVKFLYIENHSILIQTSSIFLYTKRPKTKEAGFMYNLEVKF